MRGVRADRRVRSAMKSSRLLLAALLAAPLSACTCAEDPLTHAEEPPPEEPKVMLDSGVTGLPDSGVVDPVDSGIPEGRVLTFDGTSPVILYFSTGSDLRFTLKTISGSPVPSAPVTFALTGNAGTISATNLSTDASGVVTVHFTASAMAGSGTLTGSAQYADDAVVQIQVTEDPNADLVLDVASASRIPLSNTDAFVYVGPTASLPTCAQLNAAVMPPAPTFSASFSILPGNSTFSNLTSGDSVTAFATGMNRDGVTVARGCTEGVHLVGGTATHILVTLAQLPPELDGDYDALLLLDVGATLPPPYGPTIVLITDFLSDPAGWVVYQTLAQIDANLGTTFLEWTPPTGPTRQATFAEVRANAALFGTWELARDFLDTELTNALGQTYTDVKTIGGDIAHAIRMFEVGAGYTVTSTGVPNRVQITEDWKAMVFQWQYSCPAGDLGCARRAIDLTGPNANLAPAQAVYGATINYTPSATDTERYTLALDAHSITLRYGAIILLVLDGIVFPNLPAGIAGNSLTEVIGNIADCPSTAIAIENATGLPAALFEALCDSAVMAAASYIEGQILGLDSVNNPGLIVGLSPMGGGEMVLVDHDQDLATENVESVMTYSSWSTNTSLTTPITGDGRRRAAHCTKNADCAAPRVCTPIGSYLKVRAAENDCRRPVGATIGTQACTANTDCASNLCFDAGASNTICFEACSGAGTCATGNCVDAAAPVNLDAILTGLGNAGVSACVP